MPFNEGYRELCDRWLQKAEEYNDSNLNQCFDKFITLFIVFNALYAETALVLRRKSLADGKDEYKLNDNSFPDSAAATDYVVKYLKSRYFIARLEEEEESKKAIAELKALLDQQQFYIFLDPISGKSQPDRDVALSESLRSSNSDKKAKAILELVYQVRCNMFHGRKGLSPVQHQLLLPLIVILKKVINILHSKLEREPYIAVADSHNRQFMK